MAPFIFSDILWINYYIRVDFSDSVAGVTNWQPRSQM